MKIATAANLTEHTTFIVSFFANILLIALILTRTPKNFGSYKFLMLWFAGFSLCFSVVDVLTQPVMHSYLNSCIISSYCASFGLTLVLLATHFAYRYIAIVQPQKLIWFKYPRGVTWPSIFVSVGIFWWCDAHFLLNNNPTLNSYLNETVFENYNENIEKISYVGPLYFIIDSERRIHIQWISCIATMNASCIMITTFMAIVSLGYATFKKMESVSNNVSEKTKSLQKQLFHALVSQTIIPIVFMYTPFTILFICPIISLELGSLANITSICLALYPAIDPFIAMYFIKDYRCFILKKLKLMKKVGSVEDCPTPAYVENQVI